MDFKAATDEVCATINHDDVAKALGLSVQSIRQARLGPKVRGYRTPPSDWRKSLIRLSERQIVRYRKVIEELQKDEFS